jgi:hypothetical protein
MLKNRPVGSEINSSVPHSDLKSFDKNYDLLRSRMGSKKLNSNQKTLHHHHNSLSPRTIKKLLGQKEGSDKNRPRAGKQKKKPIF